MRDKVIYSYLAALLIILPSFSRLARSHSDVKVALIADKAFDLHKSPLVSLLEVKLSQVKGIQLLERAQIDKILQEQQLSVAGLLQRHSAVRVGLLLRADAFLLLAEEHSKGEGKNGSKLLRVRLVETAHGLRLLDSFEEPDGAKLEDTVKRITEKVIAAVPKIMLPPGEAIPVGIVDIHRVQLSERYQWLARALPAMLSARLSKELRIIMLEREDLKILHDEKLLTEGEDAEFWSSGVLIDGYLQRRRTKDIEMKLFLRRASGKGIADFTVLVEPNEPLVAVDNIVSNMIQKLLNAPPTASWQPKQEAEEFLRQGQLLKNHRRHKDALPLLETAHALQPDNVLYTWTLFQNEWYAHFRAGSSYPPGGTGVSYYSDLELVEIVSCLVRQIQEGYESGLLSASDVLSRWSAPLGSRTPPAGYFASSVSVATVQIRRINRENRRIWLRTMREALKEEPDLHVELLVAWASSDVSEQLMENLRNTINELIMPPRMGGRIESAEKRYSLCRGILLFPEYGTSIRSLEKTHLKGASENFQKLWLQYVKDLTNVEDPAVKFLSSVALATEHAWYSRKSPNKVGEQEKKKASAKAKEYCYRALEILQKELKTPNEPFDEGTKRRIRDDIRVCMSDAGLKRIEAVGMLEKLYDPLIKKKDVDNLLLWRPGWRFPAYYFTEPFSQPPASEAAGRYFELLERIAAVLEAHKDETQVRKALNQIRDCLAEFKEQFPELVSAEKPANIPVTILLSKEDIMQKNEATSRRYILPKRVTLQGGMLWVTFYESSHSAYGLAGIDLVEKKLAARWQTDVSIKGSQVLRGMTICKDASYLAIRDLGLIEFPGNLATGKEFLKNPRILTQEHGLPSVSFETIAGLGSKLWIAYGGEGEECGLGIYDPKTEDWETVLCSTLKGDPPFNAGQPYRLSELTFAPPNKLFFLARGDSYSEDSQRGYWYGFWKINTNTRQLKQVRFDGVSYTGAKSIVDSGGKWWFKAISLLAEFDTKSEKTKFILVNPAMGKDIKWQPHFFVPESSWKKIPYGNCVFGYLDLSTSAVHGDRLWARLGESQLITIQRDKSLEEAEIIENNILNGGAVMRFLSTPYGLVAIGERTVGLIETEND